LEKNGERIEVVNLTGCILCKDCVEACNKNPPVIEVSGNESSFIFYLESTGALPVERVVSEALKIYETKYSEFRIWLAGIENEPKKKY
jgi:ferredoxin